MSEPTIDIHIISWNGWHESALAIAGALDGGLEQVSIIHSQPGEFVPHGAYRHIATPDDWFFGRKFRQSLASFEGDVLLQIMADAACDDWPGLLRRCRQAFQLMPQLGVWGAEVDGTFFELPRIAVSPICLSSSDGVVMDRLTCVTILDAIVWAIRRDVAERLARLDYDANNLGWGVCEAACAYCHVTNRLVVVNSAAKATHPPGSGYDHAKADAQRNAYVESLSIQERMQLKLIWKALKR